MALTNHKVINLGGGVSMLLADYTATANAAEDTYSVAGKVYSVSVVPQAAAGTKIDMGKDLFSVSTSGAVSTVTLFNHTGITAGTILIVYSA